MRLFIELEHRIDAEYSKLPKGQKPSPELEKLTTLQVALDEYIVSEIIRAKSLLDEMKAETQVASK